MPCHPQGQKSSSDAFNKNTQTHPHSSTLLSLTEKPFSLLLHPLFVSLSNRRRSLDLDKSKNEEEGRGYAEKSKQKLKKIETVKGTWRIKMKKRRNGRKFNCLFGRLLSKKTTALSVSRLFSVSFNCHPLHPSPSSTPFHFSFE